jgi:hypothetical protein|tara:strand:+ start:3606 stop:4436 length:831 start_codon:yes stop_codon:yes gene_type:complete
MLGIDPSQFKETLTPVPYNMRKEPAVTLGEKYKLLEQKFRGNQSKIEFSFDELCKVWFSCSVQLEIHKYFHPSYRDERNDKFAIIGKLANSMWRYSFGTDWNTLVAAYDNLSRFKFGDFEFRLDVTTGCNARGSSEYHSIYIDGPLAYIVYYKGKPALTISFAIVAGGRLLINQVQLINKRGNRWLYKLPCHYFNFAIECMGKAFPDFALFLVDGHSTADRIKTSYGDGYVPLADEKYKHIVKTYRQKLSGFIRRGRTKISNMTFHHLFPRQPLTN